MSQTTDFNSTVALAWSEYTSRVGIDPSEFTDAEKLAFQAGVAAGMSIGMDRASKITVDAIGSKG